MGKGLLLSNFLKVEIPVLVFRLQTCFNTKETLSVYYKRKQLFQVSVSRITFGNIYYSRFTNKDLATEFGDKRNAN